MAIYSNAACGRKRNSARDGGVHSRAGWTSSIGYANLFTEICSSWYWIHVRTFEASLAYQFPDVRDGACLCRVGTDDTIQVDFTLGKSSSDQTPGLLNPVAVAPPVNRAIPDVNWGVDLQGDLSVHVIPQVRIGVSILGGNLIDAQVCIHLEKTRYNVH